MWIPKLHRKIKEVEERICHPEEIRDGLVALDEFSDLKRELKRKGFPVSGKKKTAYSVLFGRGVIEELNEKAVTVYGPIYGDCGKFYV